MTRAAHDEKDIVIIPVDGGIFVMETIALHCNADYKPTIIGCKGDDAFQKKVIINLHDSKVHTKGCKNDPDKYDDGDRFKHDPYTLDAIALN